MRDNTFSIRYPRLRWNSWNWRQDALAEIMHWRCKYVVARIEDDDSIYGYVEWANDAQREQCVAEWQETPFDRIGAIDYVKLRDGIWREHGYPSQAPRAKFYTRNQMIAMLW